MAGKKFQKQDVTVRTLWGLAKSPELSMTGEELHLVVQAQTGKCSLRELSQNELRRVAYVLGQMKDSASGKKVRKTSACSNATDNQKKKVYALQKELGWEEEPKRLNGFVKRMFKVDSVEWLDYRQCSDLIEALKAMAARREKTGGGI